MTRTAQGPRPEGVPMERTDDIGTGQQDASRHGLRYSFLHNRSVRARVAGLVFIPLLGALIFGASVFYDAIRDFTTASSVERNTQTVRSVLTVVDRLQDERDVSALLRAGVNGDGPVASARDQTDQAIADLTARAEEMPQDDTSPFGNAIAEARETLEMLEEARGVDGRDANIERYRMLIRSLLAVIQASGAGLTDAELSEEIGVLNALARSTEAASLERGLVAQLVAIGEDVSDARNRFLAVTRTEQDLLLEPFAVSAEPDEWIAYSEARKDVDEVRRNLIASGTQVATPNEWYDVSSNRVNVMRDLQGTYADAIAQDASDAASSARLAAAATALVVLAVLVLTILSAFAVARSIVRPLRRLRSAALEAADTGLPALVSRIQEDGPAVVRRIGDAVTPEGTDEIGQVASAFNEVHATAVRVAGEQALLRQNLDTIVVNLSRRTQSLVDRQLGEIEDLESRERDPDQLGTLFRIDHLATRVRRHAESLLVLAGVEEMRRQGVAAPVLDVVRTAVGEVEQYPRIKFGVMPTDLVVPSAVDDVAHLLAELLDNATEFSAPSTAVTVTSQPLLGGGLRLQVTDQGLGIPADQLAMLNERLRQPGDIDVAASRTLGIYVVARLAARHGITVRLIPAEATSGTIAQVDLPSHLIVSPLDTTDGVLQAIQPTTPRTESLLDRPNLNREVAGPNQLPQRPTHTSPISQPAVPVARQADGGPARGDGSESKDDLWRTGRPDQGGRPTPGDTRPVQPNPGDRTRQPVTADGRNNAPASTGYQVPTPGVSPLQPQTSPLQPAMSAFQPPTARSLRGDGAGDDVSGGVSDSPIYDSVRSAWFKRGGSSDWSSPADEGWRRAAAVLRTVETATAPPAPVSPASPAAASPVPVASSPVPPVPGGLATGSPSGGPGGRAGPAPWTSGGTPGPSAQPGRPPQPASPTRPASPVLPGSPAQSGPPGLPSRSVGHPDAGRGQPGGPGQPGTPVPPANPPAQSEPVSARSSSGLPVRQRGATLVPGSIPGAEQAAGAGSGRRADASNVASTLSNLQRGVSRGREESGGWVPKRPGDSERSNS